MNLDFLFEAVRPKEEKPRNDFLPDKNGKIAIFEELYGEDPIRKSICYNFSNSHEYNKSDAKKIAAVKACLKFVKNYEWSEGTTKVNDIESFDKPLNQEKVFNIAKSLEKSKVEDMDPLIVVDKIHGFYWQTKGKKILLDGNHRLGGLKMASKEATPTYLGKYTGASEKTHNDVIKDIALSESTAFETLNLFVEGTTEYALITEASKKSKKLDPVPLTSEESGAVKAKYGHVSCSFFKDSKSGKYFCKTHRCRSKLYDSPTDIPVSSVQFVSSTS